MTRKDYNLIAACVHRSTMAKSITEKNIVRRYAGVAMARLIAIDLAASLQAENPRFDRERFLKACGV